MLRVSEGREKKDMEGERERGSERDTLFFLLVVDFRLLNYMHIIFWLKVQGMLLAI